MTSAYFKVNSGKVHFYHDLVCKLKEHNIVDDVGISMESLGGKGLLKNPKTELDFLKNQKEVNYHDVTYQSDIINYAISQNPDASKLEEYESELGDPWLQTYLNAARDEYYGDFSFKEKRSIVQYLIEHYITIFDEFNPDIFVASSMGTPTSLIPFMLVRERYNGNSFWWTTTRIQDYYAVSTSPKDTFTDVVDLYRNLKEGVESVGDYSDSYQKAVNHIENFRSEKSVRYGDKLTKRRSKSAISRPVELTRSALQYYWIYRSNDYQDDFKMEPTRKMIRRELDQIRRKRRISNSGIFENPRYESDYVYFPLHYQNEWSTLVLAPMYLNPYNQLSLIQQISRCLPINYKLYVKAHPTQLKKRPHDLEFYRKISRLHNVKLISHHIDPHDIIRNAKVITTITGTSGLQGIFYKKPVITFGDPSYDVLEGVAKCNKPEEINKMIVDTIDQPLLKDEDLSKYLTAVFEKGFRFESSARSSPTHEMYDTNLINVFTKIKQRLNNS